ncbi:MAG: hypothetical protein ACK6DM_10830 [Alphaproteobacteria bacterium]|jgi:hypothetical protein
MIICSRQEDNGSTREFLIDEDDGREICVKTHAGHDGDWAAAGFLTRSRHGIEVAVSSPLARGQFVKLDRTFRNEIAALQALAVSYHPN